MTVFDIYSIADSEFLTQVMISLAMITKTVGMAQAVKIGMLLGVFAVIFQSISKNVQEFPVGSIFLGYILFSIMFIPKVTVQITDTYTGGVSVVDEVPLGPGAAGGIISNIGKNLTDLFEVGYGPIAPHLNSNIGFADSLKILNDTRRIASQPAVAQAMNADLCGVTYGSTVGCTIDVVGSLENYIRDCTLKKIDLGLMSADELQTIPWQDALKFDSLLHQTHVLDQASNSDGTWTSCQLAWPKVSKMLTDAAKGDKTATQLFILLGITHQSASTPSAEFNNRLQGSIDGLMPMAMLSQEYVITSVIQPVLNRAASGKSLNQLDGSSALMLNAAIQQRNTQWAGEQTMFMSVIRPMMAFFEAFIYAVSPIMAFLIVLGAPGIKFAAKYMLLLIWIQLWMPLLSIVNLYIYVASHKELSNVALQPGGNFVSFYALNSAADVMQNWLAVGGMLAASTPVLALMLTYGGAVTATSMASRMAGSDHINEKITTPDPVSSAPVLNSGSMHTGNANTNSSQVTGAPVSTATAQSVLSSQVSSAQSYSREQSKQFADSYQTALQGGTSQTASSVATKAGTAALNSSTNTSISAARSHLESAMNGNDVSSGRGEALRAALAGQLAGSAATPGKVVSLSAGGSYTLTSEDTALVSSAAKIAYSDQNSSEQNRQTQAQFSDQLAQQVTSQSGRGTTATSADSATKSLMESASAANKASQQFSATKANVASVGVSDNASLQNIAQGASTGGYNSTQSPTQKEITGAKSLLGSNDRNSNDSDARTSRMSQDKTTYKQMGFSDSAADNMSVLNELRNTSNPENAALYSGLMAKIVSTANLSPSSSQSGVSANENAGLSNLDAGHVQPEQKATNFESSAPSAPSSVDTSHVQEPVQPNRVSASGAEAVSVHNSAGADKVNSDAGGYSSHLASDQQLREAVANLHHQAVSGNADGFRVTEAARDAAQEIKNIATGVGGYSKSIDEQREAFDKLPEQQQHEVAQAVIAAADKEGAGSLGIGGKLDRVVGGAFEKAADSQIGRGIQAGGALATGNIIGAVNAMTSKTDVSSSAMDHLNNEETGAVMINQERQAFVDGMRAHEDARARQVESLVKSADSGALGIGKPEAQLFVGMSTGNDSMVESAKHDLQVKYADKDSAGNPISDGHGSYQMSSDNRTIYDDTVKNIEDASHTPSQAAAMLSSLATLNKFQK